jgi:hypothetical protein
LLFSGGATFISQPNVAQSPDLLSLGSLIFNVFAGVFVIYTAARGLELFADVAEKIMIPTESQTEVQPTPSS